MNISVLDHGYVRLVETWGGGDANVPEAGIIEAARQSTQGSFRGWHADKKLLAYLYNNKHSTPFEFAGMTIEVQAPIFVFREWHRHRTQGYNEMSARYAPLPDLYYLPSCEDVHKRANAATSNAQAAGVGLEVSQSAVDRWHSRIQSLYQAAETLYQDGLSAGIPKELARVIMPVGHYSRMRATANLRNWLGFITLRADPKAQKEIRLYAEAVLAVVRDEFPRTAALFDGAA